MEQPPVSVVVAAYNAASTLARALDSIAAQSMRPAEVIVVDDASRDDTAAIAKAHELRPTVVRHAVNRGGAAALQTGLEAARSDWVAFLDADDEWLPAKIERQVRALAAEPDASVVASGFVFVDRGGREAWDYGLAPFAHAGREFWRNLLLDSAILQSSAMVRRRLALATGGVATAMRTGYDQQLFVRLAALGPVAYVHQKLVRYHDSPGSLTKLPRPDDILGVLAMHREHVSMFAPRLSALDREAALRRRYAEAAIGLIAARAWGDAVRCIARAVKRGEPPAPMLRRLAVNLPPLRQLKQLAQRG